MHAKDEQTDVEDVLGIFESDSSIYTENYGTGMFEDPGVANEIDWHHWNRNVSRSSTCFAQAGMAANL